jgi:hypothetical protein
MRETTAAGEGGVGDGRRPAGSRLGRPSPLSKASDSSSTGESQLPFETPSPACAEVPAEGGARGGGGGEGEAMARTPSDGLRLALPASPAPPASAPTDGDAAGAKMSATDRLLLYDPLGCLNKLLTSIRSKHSRPDALVDMSHEQLLAERNDVKKVLLHYETRFKDLKHRPPSREEKAPLRPMYHRHKDLKKALDLPSSSTTTKPAAARKTSGRSETPLVKGPASRSSAPTSTARQPSANGSVGLSSTTDFSKLALPAHAHMHGADSPQKLKSRFAELKREKKALQILLNEWK